MEFSKPEYRAGSSCLLQGIFPTQGLNSGLPHCRRILYQLSHQGSPCAYAAAAAKSLQSCPTLRPQRRQPTRLLRPWDSPGENTGVGCHFLLQCMTVKSESEVAQLCPTLSDPMDCSLPGSSVHQEYWSWVPLPSPINMINMVHIYILKHIYINIINMSYFIMLFAFKM